jgi:hypothetical protein
MEIIFIDLHRATLMTTTTEDGPPHKEEVVVLDDGRRGFVDGVEWDYRSGETKVTVVIAGI